MRRIEKFKQYPKILSLRIFFPLFQRVQKFKRPKWHKLQKFYQKILIAKDSKKKNKRINKNLENLLTTKKKFSFWSRVKNRFAEGLDQKRAIFTLFDNVLSVSYFKKILRKKTKTKLNILISTFVEPLFRIDILLWKLQFFSSVYTARQQIYLGNILLNAKKQTTVCFLKAGDILTVKLSKTIVHSYHRELLPKFLFSFLEFDLYSKNIIVLKDVKKLSASDLCLTFNHHIDTKFFFDYVRLK